MGGLLAAQLGDGCSSPGSVDTGGRPSYGPLIGAATRAHAYVWAPMAPGVGFCESAYTAPDGGVRARPGCCPGCSGDSCRDLITTNRPSIGCLEPLAYADVSLLLGKCIQRPQHRGLADVEGA